MTLKTPKVMGILNVTPDSFYDGGQYISKKKLTARIKKLIKEKADIIDVGGESTRPGSKSVSAAEEIKRVVPAITAIREISKDILISVDTCKPQVANAALKAGANMVNDITGLKNPKMLTVIKKFNCPVIIMHIKGTPETMQSKTDYKNILKEIYGFFDEKIKQCKKAGIKLDKIIIDVGIGFAKTKEQNLFLIRNLRHFKKLGCLLMLGASRKSFIGLTLDKPNPKDRLYGSLSAAVCGYLNGADILRVHDVKETKEVLQIAKAVKNAKL